MLTLRRDALANILARCEQAHRTMYTWSVYIGIHTWSMRSHMPVLNFRVCVVCRCLVGVFGPPLLLVTVASLHPTSLSHHLPSSRSLPGLRDSISVFLRYFVILFNFFWSCILLVCFFVYCLVSPVTCLLFRPIFVPHPVSQASSQGLLNITEI